MVVAYTFLILVDVIVAVIGAHSGLQIDLIFWGILASPIVMLCLCVLTVAGLVAYISGRKIFLESKRIVYLPLVILSLILVIEGILIALSTNFGLEYVRTKIPGGYPLTLEGLIEALLSFVWSGLKISSGLLFLIDGFIIVTKQRDDAI
jgi:hypothetical protein